MTPEQLRRDLRYAEHHTSTQRGYISRKSVGIVKEYRGKYGTGYVLLTPRWDTTQYCYCTYFIMKGDNTK